MKRFRIVLVILIITAIVLSLLLWRLADVCVDVRCQLASIMPRLAIVQNEVARSKKGAISERAIPKSGDLDFGYVGKDGTIIVINETSKLVIVARPQFDSNVVSWKCIAYPETANIMSLVADCGAKFRTP